MVIHRWRSKYIRGWRVRYTPKHLHADDIIRIMRTPVDLSWRRKTDTLPEDEFNAIFVDWKRHWYPRKLKLEREATVSALHSALSQVTTPRDRAILIEILGCRAIARSIPTIVPYIHDRSPRVRSEAADAIGKIALLARRQRGERAFQGVDLESVGSALLQRLIHERRLKTRTSYLPIAIGSVGYQSGIPELMRELSSGIRWMRGGAATALGVLRAKEAKEALQRAINVESDSYALQQMQFALNEIAKEQVKHGE